MKEFDFTLKFALPNLDEDPQSLLDSLFQARGLGIPNEERDFPAAFLPDLGFSESIVPLLDRF